VRRPRVGEGLTDADVRKLEADNIRAALRAAGRQGVWAGRGRRFARREADDAGISISCQG